jgi:hypothetical protein
VKLTQFNLIYFNLFLFLRYLSLGLVKSTLYIIYFNLFLFLRDLSLGLVKSTLYKDALNLGLVKSTLDVTDGNATEKMEKFTLSMSHESI